EVKQDFPSRRSIKAKEERKTAVEKRLLELRGDKLSVEDAALQAAIAQNVSEMKRDEAAAARDAHLAEARAIEPQIPRAEIALETAKASKKVNPRFASQGSKANQQAQLYASAVEISKA